MRSSMGGDISYECLVVKTTAADSWPSLKCPSGKCKYLKIEKTRIVEETVAAREFVLWIIDETVMRRPGYRSYR